MKWTVLKHVNGIDNTVRFTIRVGSTARAVYKIDARRHIVSDEG